MSNKTLTITVSGVSGSGKTTVAALIQTLLKSQNINTRLELTDKEMAPCPTTLRQRVHSLIDNGLKVTVIEKPLLSKAPQFDTTTESFPPR